VFGLETTSDATFEAHLVFTRIELEEVMDNVQDVVDLEAPVLLLRVEEAAARLGIARTSMYQLVKSGEVESVHVGRLRRIPVACLEEYVEDLRTRPLSPRD
jgi:excisionase family DNA binding protein